MSLRFRVPKLNPNIVIRHTTSRQLIEAADWLVFRNYVAEEYWDDDEKHLTENKWLHSPHRDVFVAMCEDEVVGTISLIHDSTMGLPSDDFQPMWLRRFRHAGDRLAECSAFAIRTDRAGLRNLHFFLLACYMQYSFYHTRVDRLVKACRPSHANFYADVMCFEKIGGVVHNNYARRPSQLLSMDLIDAHRVLSDRYEPDGASLYNLYRFLLVNKHPLIQLDTGASCRSRHHDWVAFARERRIAAQNQRGPRFGAQATSVPKVATGGT